MGQSAHEYTVRSKIHRTKLYMGFGKKSVSVHRNLIQLRQRILVRRNHRRRQNQQVRTDLHHPFQHTIRKTYLEVLVPIGHIDIFITVVTDETDPRRTRISKKILAQTIRPHIPVQHKHIHLRVDLFQLQRTLDGLGAAHLRTVWTLRYPGSHALDKHRRIGFTQRRVLVDKPLLKLKTRDHTRILAV